jgi:hypothetical protein
MIEFNNKHVVSTQFERAWKEVTIIYVRYYPGGIEENYEKHQAG